MKKLLALVAIFMVVSTICVGQSNTEVEKFFKLSNFYFKRYVNDGLVNYQYAKANSKEIIVMYQLIGEADLKSLSENERKAFFINAYNLLVIYQIVQFYPIANPLDEEGFFDKKTHMVAGEMLTLNDVEFNRMFAEFKDPRFHFVLACAAKSCPKLANFSYQPSNVEQSLEARTKMMLNDDNFIKVDPASKKVSVSKIFEWYKQDFGGSNVGVINFINRYRSTKIPVTYTVEFYEYDWRLNERKS